MHVIVKYDTKLLKRQGPSRNRIKIFIQKGQSMNDGSNLILIEVKLNFEAPKNAYTCNLNFKRNYEN
jgi:hypothetical protein